MEEQIQAIEQEAGPKPEKKRGRPFEPYILKHRRRVLRYHDLLVWDVANKIEKMVFPLEEKAKAKEKIKELNKEAKEAKKQNGN